MKNVIQILKDMGACETRAKVYARLNPKQAWNKINNLQDFAWLLFQLSQNGTEASKKYYGRAYFGALAAVAEEHGLDNYVDELNALAARKTDCIDPNDAYVHTPTAAPCGMLGCWDCIERNLTNKQVKSACKNIRRVVVMPTEKELLACAADSSQGELQQPKEPSRT